jgi:hypothetical protein
MDERKISEILYTLERLSMFPDDIDSVSVELAVFLWGVVEYARNIQELDDVFLS